MMGKADAEATRIYAEAYGRDPEFYQFLKTMETYRKTMRADTTLILVDRGRVLQVPEAESLVCGVTHSRTFGVDNVLTQAHDGALAANRRCWMKVRTRAVSSVLAGVLVTFAFASSALAQRPEGVAGTWKLNVAKSKYNPGPPPKSMTIVYAPAGDSVKITVDLVPATGEPQKWEMIGLYDDKPHTVSGNPEADSISMKRVNDTTGESTFRLKGKVMAVNTRVLSADGKTLTITSKGQTADGKSRNDVAVYEKQP